MLSKMHTIKGEPWKDRWERAKGVSGLDTGKTDLPRETDATDGLTGQTQLK